MRSTNNGKGITDTESNVHPILVIFFTVLIFLMLTAMFGIDFVKAVGFVTIPAIIFYKSGDRKKGGH